MKNAMLKDALLWNACNAMIETFLTFVRQTNSILITNVMKSGVNESESLSLSRIEMNARSARRTDLMPISRRSLISAFNVNESN